MKLDTILKVMQALGLNPLQEVGVMKRWDIKAGRGIEVLIPFRKSG